MALRYLREGAVQSEWVQEQWSKVADGPMKGYIESVNGQADDIDSPASPLVCGPAPPDELRDDMFSQAMGPEGRPP